MIYEVTINYMCRKTIEVEAPDEGIAKSLARADVQWEKYRAGDINIEHIQKKSNDKDEYLIEYNADDDEYFVERNKILIGGPFESMNKAMDFLKEHDKSGD